MSDTTTTTTAALPLTPGRWALDPYHSSVGFTVRHLGISKVQGRFGQLEAELIIGETADDCAVTATVALGSIDTGNAVRDEHVRAANMLDVERRPTMTFRSTTFRSTTFRSTTFRSTRVQSPSPVWSLQGELAIGDVTRPVTFEVDFGGVEDSVVDGRRHAGFEARGEIRRSEFGLGFGPGDTIVGDVVKIQIDVQFIEPE